MSTTHLSDTGIQLYLTDKDSCTPQERQHMQTCEACQEQAAIYRSLFRAIQEQPASSFDFDLEALVLSELPARRRQPRYLAIMAATGLLVVLVYLSKQHIQALIKGLPALSVLLLAIPVTAILLFQCADLWKQYSKKLQQIGAQPV